MEGKVGFVGLGVMGMPMAKNLIAAGRELFVFDVDESSMNEIEAAGAMTAKSLNDIWENCTTAFTMLPDGPQVEEVLVGAGGLLEAPQRSCSIVVDMSTIAPHVSRDIATTLSAIDVAFFDAPVSGGYKGAVDGTLSVMVGGMEDRFAEIEPLLRNMGTTITFLGPAGAGQAAKMCNQMICAMNIQALCEALAVGEAEGLDLRKLTGVLSGGAANSWMLENLGAKILDKDVSAGFRIDLQVKDLRIGLDSAMRRHVPTPGTALSTSLYIEAQAHREGANGNQALFKVYDRLRGAT